MLKIRSGDKVMVCVGKDRGKIGIVSKVLRRHNSKKHILLVLEGINLVKKHTKANPNKNKTGGIVTMESPINYSNVAIINPSTEKIDKVKFDFLSNKKVRVFKSDGKVI